MSSNQQINLLQEDNWTEEILPQKSLLDFNLKEVWRYRDLLVLFVKRDFVAKYKQTILGPLWHFIQPALSTFVSVLLFNVIANIGTNGTNPVLFQMSGIILWNYFATTLTGCSAVFTSNASIFGKVYFPRLVMPLSIVASNIVQFGIQLLLFIVINIFFYFRGSHIYIGWQLLLIPIYIIIMAGIGLGLGIIISSLTTKYRDFTVLVTFGVQLLMYGSAVNYPLQELAHKKAIVYQALQYNPLAGVIEGFRNAVLGFPVNFHQLLYPVSFMVISILGGIVLFNKVERTFMDTV